MDNDILEHEESTDKVTGPNKLGSGTFIYKVSKGIIRETYVKSDKDDNTHSRSFLAPISKIIE